MPLCDSYFDCLHTCVVPESCRKVKGFAVVGVVGVTGVAGAAGEAGAARRRERHGRHERHEPHGQPRDWRQSPEAFDIQQ